MQQKCAYCEHATDRETLAEVLTKGEYQEQPQQTLGDPTLRPMRDSQDRYTVTEVATTVLTPTVSVRSQTDWTAYHMQLIPSSWYQKDARDHLVLLDTQDLDEDMVAELEAHAGRGDVQYCPEETALMLGIDEHRSVPVDVVETNQACGEPGLTAHLDSLSFKDAARLLKTVPKLLGECSCRPNED